MSRLTERNPYWMGEEFWTSAKEPDEEEIDAVYEKLRKYENAEEDGLVVSLPVPIGTKVYGIYTSMTGKNPVVLKFSFDYGMIPLWGKSVFGTEEAAKEHIGK